MGLTSVMRTCCEMFRCWSDLDIRKESMLLSLAAQDESARLLVLVCVEPVKGAGWSALYGVMSVRVKIVANSKLQKPRKKEKG